MYPFGVKSNKVMSKMKIFKYDEIYMKYDEIDTKFGSDWIGF